MIWHIELAPSAQKDLAKLDSSYAHRISRFLFDRIAALENPRCIGEPLTEPRLAVSCGRLSHSGQD